MKEPNKEPMDAKASEKLIKRAQSRQIDPAAKKRNPTPMPNGRKGPHKRNS